MMHLRDTGCCGLREITSLSHHPTPLDAMGNLCQVELDYEARRDKGSYARQSPAGFCYLYSHYVFTAAYYERETPETNYGYKFAKFILDNQLGTVVETPRVFNELAHPDHMVVAWLWTPDQEAVEKWFVNVGCTEACRSIEKEIQNWENHAANAPWDKDYYGVKILRCKDKIKFLKGLVEKRVKDGAEAVSC